MYILSIFTLVYGQYLKKDEILDLIIYHKCFQQKVNYFVGFNLAFFDLTGLVVVIMYHEHFLLKVLYKQKKKKA